MKRTTARTHCFRPAKGPCVKVALDQETSDKLRFLQDRLPVRPPITGLVRAAVNRLVDDELARRGLRRHWEARRRTLEIVR